MPARDGIMSTKATIAFVDESESDGEPIRGLHVYTDMAEARPQRVQIEVYGEDGAATVAITTQSWGAFLRQLGVKPDVCQDRAVNADEMQQLLTALKAEVLRTIEAAHEMRMQELTLLRSMAARRSALRLAPWLINRVARREIFPQPVVDTLLMEAIAESMTEESLKVLADSLARGSSPELAAAVYTRLVDLRRA